MKNKFWINLKKQKLNKLKKKKFKYQILYIIFLFFYLNQSIKKLDLIHFIVLFLNSVFLLAFFCSRLPYK